MSILIKGILNILPYIYSQQQIYTTRIKVRQLVEKLEKELKIQPEEIEEHEDHLKVQFNILNLEEQLIEQLGELLEL